MIGTFLTTAGKKPMPSSIASSSCMTATRSIKSARMKIKSVPSCSMAPTADAAKLQTLFKETEDFWAQFKTKDALDAAKGAQDAAASITAAAKANNVQKAQASYNGVGKFCNACHTSHREQMPDKTYKIKP